MTQRFQKGSGVYICVECKEQTRETGEGESTFELCAACFEIAEYENEHNDDGHDGEVKDCPECTKFLSTKAKNKLKSL